MINNNIEMYEGDETFLIASFAEADSAKIYPILETLSSAGYRLRFNNSDSSEEEWAENASLLLDSCHTVLFFISPAWTATENCRNDFAFAKLRSKKMVGIILEPTQLPVEFQEALKLFPCIAKYDYCDEARFYQNLFRIRELNECFYTAEEIATQTYPATNNGFYNNPGNKQGNPQTENVIYDVKPAQAAPVVSSAYPYEQTDRESEQFYTAVNNIQKNKRKTFWIIFATVGAALLFIILLSVYSSPHKIELTPYYTVYSDEDNISLSSCFIDKDIAKKLNKFNNIEYLTFTDCDLSQFDFSEFKHFDQLRSLTLSNCTGIKDYSFLKNASDLRNITINDDPTFTDLKASIPKDVYSITINNCGVTNISRLNYFTSLDTISITDCNLEDVDSRLTLKMLSNVTLSNCRITDYSFLNNSKNLRYINLSNNNIENFELPDYFIQNGISLKLSNSNPSDKLLSQIKDCTSLYYLYLDGIPMEDLPEIENMSELKELSLAGCGIKRVDANAFKNKSELRTLILCQNELTEIPSFGTNMGNYFDVDLSHNQIKSFEGIETCSFYNLFMYDNPIDWTDKNSLAAYEKADVSKIILSYNPQISKVNLKPSSTRSIVIIDCPNETEEDNLYTDFGIYSFYTMEEAEAGKESRGFDVYAWGL